MAIMLRWLVLLMGITCMVIGVFHFALGIHSVPGEGHGGATVDSRERFYAAVFIGYGIAWVWVARQSPVPSPAVRLLAGTFFLGGLGRLLSMVVEGQPNWFQVMLTVVELALPPVFFWLSTAEDAIYQPSAGRLPDRPFQGKSG